MNIRTLWLGLLVAACCALPLNAQIDPSHQPAVSPGASLKAPAADALAAVREAAAAAFRADHPEAAFYQTGSQITRVYGAAFGGGSDPVAAAEAFREQYAGLFGLPADELRLGSNLSDGRYTQPVMYEPNLGGYKFTLVSYLQYRDGLPVYGGELRLLVLNQSDYPLVWAGSSLRELGDFRAAAPAVNAEAGRQAALAAAPSLVNFGDVRVMIWAGTENVAAMPKVACVFEADNYGSPTAEKPEKWLFVTDAADGTILHQESRIIFTDVTGSVKGMATTLPKSAECNPEVNMVMPYARVSITGGNTAYADAGGNFTIPNPGTTPVTVTSYKSGLYFNVIEKSGTLETLTMSVTPPAPANFMHNSANTDERIRAQTNAYVEANRVRDWCLTYHSSYPTIATQTNFTVNVNYSSTCNAYYDGSSINFYLAGGGCSNTAFSSVVHHEYGHHMVATGGSGQGEYGEGMSDTVGALIANDPVLGYGFELDCGAGIRTADNTCQYLASGCSTCGSAIHACGQLLSGIVWSIRNNLVVTEPADYLNIISSLTVNSILLHTGTGINAQIAIDFLTLDDDDGNIGNGTPHRTEICNGFSAHGLSCPALEVGMSVSPAGGFTSTGQAGGPFTPGSMNYTVWNLGPTPSIAYNVTKAASWLTLTNPTGTVAMGTPVTVTVSLNANANSLADGDYSDTIQFTNTTDHIGDQSRQAMLRVGYNDLCANAKTACPGSTYTGTTVGATVDGTAGCGTSDSTPDMWYKYTPATSGTATFSLCGTGTTYDSVLSIHTGTCPGTSTNQVSGACDDDGCGTGGGPSVVSNVSVTAGVTYLIRVSGWNGDTGAYSLSITGPPCGSAAPNLLVTPSDGLSSAGNSGGPFTPGSKVYTLQNTGSSSLDYTVGKTQSWVTLSGTGGTLSAGGSTTVTVSINSNANSLGSGTYSDTLAFTNATNHQGDTTRSVSLQVGVPGLIYSWNMDTNPNWTISGGQWAWGTPTGGGGQYGGPDPTSGHTGTSVYGYNLAGDYANSIPEYDLTTTAINCTNLTQVSLKFWRWLGVERNTYDHAYVRVSNNNGSTWTTVWQNPDSETADTTWSQQSYDISVVADNQATVYVRWTMGPTDTSWQYCGWNIDDVEIWGLDSTSTPTGACCYGDAPCAIVTQAYCSSGGGAYQGNNTTCTLHVCCDMLGDMNGDTYVNGADIQGFVNAMLAGFAPCADLVAPYDVLDMADVSAFVNLLLSS